LALEELFFFVGETTKLWFEPKELSRAMKLLNKMMVVGGY
jgi:hypothetical protein